MMLERMEEDGKTETADNYSHKIECDKAEEDIANKRFERYSLPTTPANQSKDVISHSRL